MIFDLDSHSIVCKLRAWISYWTKVNDSIFRPDQSVLMRRELCIDKAISCLSPFEFSLFSSVLTEWEGSPLLSDCLKIWKPYEKHSNFSCARDLYILSFNVRGFGLRWEEEVFLVNASFDFDILILLETGDFDRSFKRQTFEKFNQFYQRGEN